MLCMTGPTQSSPLLVPGQHGGCGGGEAAESSCVCPSLLCTHLCALHRLECHTLRPAREGRGEPCGLMTTEEFQYLLPSGKVNNPGKGLCSVAKTTLIYYWLCWYLRV